MSDMNLRISRSKTLLFKGASISFRGTVNNDDGSGSVAPRPSPLAPVFRAVILTLVMVAALLVTPGLSPTLYAQGEAGTPASGKVSIVRVNVRSGPSIRSAVVGALAQNTTVEIVDKSADGQWYRVRAAGLPSEAWVFAKYVVADPFAGRGDGSRGDAGRGCAGDGQRRAGRHSCAARINVRSGSGTGYAIVSSASAGSVLPIVGINSAGDWYQVRVPGLGEPAWVLGGLTRLSGSLDGIPTVEVAPAAVAPAAAAPALCSRPCGCA